MKSAHQNDFAAFKRAYKLARVEAGDHMIETEISRLERNFMAVRCIVFARWPREDSPFFIFFRTPNTLVTRCLQI